MGVGSDWRWALIGGGLCLLGKKAPTKICHQSSQTGAIWWSRSPEITITTDLSRGHHRVAGTDLPTVL